MLKLIWNRLTKNKYNEGFDAAFTVIRDMIDAYVPGHEKYALLDTMLNWQKNWRRK